jgi:spermidine synthase
MKNVRVMVTNPHGRQSAMYLDDQIELASSYTRYYKLAPHFQPNMRDVLMIGGGGYSFPKYTLENYPQVEMDVVEIDPEVTAIARKFFGLQEDPRLRIYHEDARVFLNKTDKKYDVVLCDAFNSHYSIPFHLTTIETVQKLYDILSDDGVVLANILSAIEGDGGRFLRAEVATYKTVFPQVYLFPVSDTIDGTKWQNVMLVALKSNREPPFTSINPDTERLLSHLWKKPVPEDIAPLTDDYAPVDRYVLEY